MSEYEEQLGAMRAEMDQAKEALGEMASTMARYFNELVDSGFTRGEALLITINMQQSVLGNRPHD